MLKGPLEDAIMSTAAERLREARARYYSTATEAARAHGWKGSTYAAHENGQNQIREHHARKYGRAFRVSWLWLLTGEGQSVGTDPDDEENLVPVMGYVGAGGEIHVDGEQPPPDGFDQVELPFTMPEPLIAFEIKGDSMYPSYDPGDIIVCFRHQRQLNEWFLGRTAIVRVSSGERYLKRITLGSRPGTFTLQSWNADPIEDVMIEWVGEIVATVKEAGVRRMARWSDNHGSSKGRATSTAR